jgi:hypothetical protein
VRKTNTDGRAVIHRHSIPEPNTGCWLWTGHVMRHGYGLAWFMGKKKLAHRLSFEAFGGESPEGAQLDHLCRVRCCVNPAHLEPVSCRTNLLRGETLAAANAARTHCKRGHPFDDANTYRCRGSRCCRICRRDRRRLRDAGAIYVRELEPPELPA